MPPHISTGTGDTGETSLVGGRRVRKTDPRVIAVGTVDEVNDALGAAAAFLGADVPAHDLVRRIQSDLFVLGADLAAPQDVRDPMRVSESDVRRITAEIERIEQELPPLKHFILPGGTKGAAMLQVARTTARRAEREAWRLLESGAHVNPHALVYLNRLSDLLFLMARAENHRSGIEEPKWVGKGER